MKFTAEQGGQLGAAVGKAIGALMAIPPGLAAIAAEISSCDDRLERIRDNLSLLQPISARLEAIDHELANIRQQLKDNN